MIISKEDRNESKKVRRIIQKVEKIDANYVSSESEIINKSKTTFSNIFTFGLQR
jgi:hypothetical protein